MSADRFRIGQLVSAADSAKLAALCATYTHYSIHGIIVAVDGHRVDVKWIDYIGPQRQTYLLDPSLLRAGTLTTGTRTRVFSRRCTAPAQQTGRPYALSPHAQPSFEIRELKIYASGIRESATGLQFHTVDDANIALHAIADAQEAHQPTFGPDLTSTIPGAHIVVVSWATYTALYRLERIDATCRNHAAPTALAG